MIMKPLTPSRDLCRALSCVALFIGISCHVAAADESVRAEPPEFAGIARIKESVFVCAVLDGECKWLSSVGQMIGPFKLVWIDPESNSVDFESNGVSTRVWLRSETIKHADTQGASDILSSSLEVILKAMKEKAVFVGFDDLSEAQKDENLMAQLDRVLNDPDLSPEERRELLATKLNQERLMNIGPKGISEAEASALGISRERATMLNRMHNMGPLLLELSKEEGKPVTLKID